MGQQPTRMTQILCHESSEWSTSRETLANWQGSIKLEDLYEAEVGPLSPDKNPGTNHPRNALRFRRKWQKPMEVKIISY